MEGMEAVCFEIISTVGAAKSAYIGAIEKAKTGDYEEAAALIDQGNEMSGRPYRSCGYAAERCGGRTES